MSKNYVVGFPRIGEKRELKKVLEQYWAKQIDFKEVEYLASQLKKRHWNYQKENERLCWCNGCFQPSN